ncbi:16426_t:CDS:2, partial [Funneliformis geosporum]
EVKHMLGSARGGLNAPYTTPSKDSDWLANVLCEWNKSVITVQVPTTFHNIIKGGNIPLNTIFPE